MGLAALWQRQTQRDGCAVTKLALDEEGTAMILDQTAANRQAEADPVCLCGIERLKDPLKGLLGDSRPGIADGKFQPRPFGALRLCLFLLRIVLRQREFARSRGVLLNMAGNSENAAVRHGL